MSADVGFIPADSVSVRDQLAVFGRRWRVVVVFVVLGLLASLLYIHSKPVSYVSHAEVQVKEVTSNQFAGNGTPIANSVAMPTERTIATSQSVANVAAVAIGGGVTGHEALSHLSVTVPASTQVLLFSYKANTPKAAQTGARAFASAYIAQRKSTNASEIASLSRSLTSALAKLTSQHTSISQRIAATKNPSTKAALESQLSPLDSSISATSQQLTLLRTVDPTGASLVESATLPTARAGSSHSLILAGGAVIGLLLGLIVAFLVDGLDDHVRGPQDLAALVGAPVLTRVPILRSLIPWRRYDLAAEGTSHPKVAEAYRTLANRLVVSASQDSTSSILVASPANGEGRSSVAANLAASLVDLGFSVWLVSADLTPPQVHRLFAPEEAPGLITSLPLTNSVKPLASVSELTIGVAADERPEGVEHSGHLTLMSSVGRTQPQGRLLSPLVLARQVRENRRLVDVTIVDAPALLDFADAIPLLPVVDGVLVVADAGLTTRSDLLEMNDLLMSTRATVIGAVLNRDGSRVVSRRVGRARRRATRLRRNSVGHPAGAGRRPAETLRDDPPSGPQGEGSATDPLADAMGRSVHVGEGPADTVVS